jgi:hypothetical protein
MASSSQREGMRSASLRGHDTRARRPAVRLARKMAVDAAHSDRSCWKKTTPYAPKTNAGHHTTRAAATTATDVACVIRSVMAVTPSRSSAEPPTSLAPMSQDVSELMSWNSATWLMRLAALTWCIRVGRAHPRYRSAGAVRGQRRDYLGAATSRASASSKAIRSDRDRSADLLRDGHCSLQSLP